MRMKPYGAVLLAAALGGCSTVADTFGDPYVAPGKYQFLRCEDLAKPLATAEARNQELHALMERAATGGGGTAVNWFVYEPDLKGVEADLRLLRQTAAEKKCGPEITKAAPKTDVSPLH
jgi:hypothetical protein